MRRTRKLRNNRVDEATKIARRFLPENQADRGCFKAVDVVNHSDADQRYMVRSGEKRTVKRKTRVEMMCEAGIITRDQAAACEWYASCYELGFQTIGCTANYSGAGGGSFGSGDLLARYRAQAEARENYFYAKLAIPEHLVVTFDRIVLGTGQPPHKMPKVDKLRFSLAAFVLHNQIGHMLAIAA